MLYRVISLTNSKKSFKSYMYSYCCPKHNRLVCNSQYFLCQGNLSGNMTWAAMQTHEEEYRDNKTFCAMACIYVGDVVLLTTPTILVVLQFDIRFKRIILIGFEETLVSGPAIFPMASPLCAVVCIFT